MIFIGKRGFSAKIALLLLIAISLEFNCSTCQRLIEAREEFSSKKTDCSRKCDTKYSNADCWKKSFIFFTDDFIFNLLNFLKTAHMLSDYNERSSFHHGLKFLRNETQFEKFSEPFQKHTNQQLVEFSDTMKKIYKLIVNDYERLMVKNQTWLMLQEQRIKGRLDCPRSKCFEVKDTFMQRQEGYDSKIRMLKVLTAFFASASSLLIGTYLFLYLLIESRLLKTYKKL